MMASTKRTRSSNAREQQRPFFFAVEPRFPVPGSGESEPIAESALLGSARRGERVLDRAAEQTRLVEDNKGDRKGSGGTGRNHEFHIYIFSKRQIKERRKIVISYGCSPIQ